MDYHPKLTSAERMLTTGHHTLSWVNHIQSWGHDDFAPSIQPLDAPIYMAAGSTRAVKDGGLGIRYVSSVDMDHLMANVV